MSTVHDRLKALEAVLEHRQARDPDLTDDMIDGMDDVQAENELLGETDRLTLLTQLEAEQRRRPVRRSTTRKLS